jgi:hypothetical protein
MWFYAEGKTTGGARKCSIFLVLNPILWRSLKQTVGVASPEEEIREMQTFRYCTEVNFFPAKRIVFT